MKKPHDSKQEELPLSSLAPHDLFPGRSVLYVHEVAKTLECSIQHVIHLIEEYEETGGKSGLKGFSIARGWYHGMKTPRNCWRIAVSDFDGYRRALAASHQTTT